MIYKFVHVYCKCVSVRERCMKTGQRKNDFTEMTLIILDHNSYKSLIDH